MPSTLNAPVLQVDANIVKLVDTSNPQNLFNLWSTTTQPRDIQQPNTLKSSAEDVPQLSGSVDSIADEEAVEFSSDSSPVDIVHPRIRRQDSCTIYPSRRDRHISSDNLEKMVASIVEQKESLSAPLPEIPASLSPPKQEEQKEELDSPPALSYSGSTTTESPSKDSDRPSERSQDNPSSLELPMIKTTTVVRGFSPAQHPHPAAFTPLRSTTDIPEPKSSPAAKKVEPKKKATFMLGASSEESYNSDDGQTVEVRHQKTLAPPAVVVNKPKMFQIGGSSEEDSSIKSALASPRNPKLALPKKSTSFANNLTTTIPSASSSAIIEDDEEISYDESAIESDDDDEWEDSNEDSGTNSVDEKSLFQRVDSKANLTSRRSLITLALEQNQRRGNLGGVASRSTPAIPHRGRAPLSGPSPLVSSPNDSDDAPLTMKRQPRATPMRPINEVPRSTVQPKPIMAAPLNGVGQQQPLALSPRTTRRNMLATELTESLRRDLLHERSQLKRRHTSTNVANLKQYPQQPYMSRVNGDINASSWNEEFSRDAFGGYYSKGW
ncbi:DUF1752-domain-containing protein [Cryphonectria parasitica EP155]|uniref:DUF1752-domain-containing protein n=1 Tax=Cryphonectria parasitica (strain ATCC 38755 / EP155) TaxID=660469 RepID=A0A9P4XWA7_CRYP1|nr:DUF1752-domain-containing protein [Cryphonectria parasitica EP155]KAF3761997.1 DUF1752-domain-containing protein [Cryphonectria parasitica EP155]